MDKNGQDGDNPAASVGAKQVRTWRSRRIEAGLVEVKAWVREADLAHVTALLEPLTEAGLQQLKRHERQSQINLVIVTLRFPGTPPHAFREKVLREEWGLSWDRAHGYWHGGVENKAAANELRRMTASFGGVVETV